MNQTLRRAFAMIALALPALAIAKITAAEERLYGGVYSNACSEPAQLRVRLFGDTMVVEQAGKAVAAQSFKSSASVPAGATPPAFKIAYVGQVKGGDGLVFVLTHDAAGLFVTLEGGPVSLAMLGAGLQGRKLRHCDPNRNALPGAPVARSLSPPDLLRDPSFKVPYLKALGPLSRERWLTTLSGPAPEVKSLRVAGGDYQLVSVCKPHDCAEHNTVLLFDAAHGVVFGKVMQSGRSTLLGNPPAAVAAELEKIWVQEWRR